MLWAFRNITSIASMLNGNSRLYPIPGKGTRLTKVSSHIQYNAFGLPAAKNIRIYQKKFCNDSKSFTERSARRGVYRISPFFVTYPQLYITIPQINADTCRIRKSGAASIKGETSINEGMAPPKNPPRLKFNP